MVKKPNIPLVEKKEENQDNEEEHSKIKFKKLILLKSVLKWYTVCQGNSYFILDSVKSMQ